MTVNTDAASTLEQKLSFADIEKLVDEMKVDPKYTTPRDSPLFRDVPNYHGVVSPRLESGKNMKEIVGVLANMKFDSAPHDVVSTASNCWRFRDRLEENLPYLEDDEEVDEKENSKPGLGWWKEDLNMPKLDSTDTSSWRLQPKRRRKTVTRSFSSPKPATPAVKYTPLLLLCEAAAQTSTTLKPESPPKVHKITTRKPFLPLMHSLTSSDATETPPKRAFLLPRTLPYQEDSCFASCEDLSVYCKDLDLYITPVKKARKS